MNNVCYRLLTVSALAALHGCLPQPVDRLANPMLSLNVAESFSFSLTRDIQLNINVANSLFSGERFRVNVYDAPLPDGNLITAGVTDAAQKLTLEFRVPAATDTLYVEKLSPFGSSEVTKVLAKDYESVSFKTVTPAMSLRVGAGSGIDCLAGATKVYTNYSGGYIDVNAGEIVSLTGSFAGGLNIRGGTVRVCGKASISGISLDRDESQLYFLESATATVSNLNINASRARVYNYANALTINSSASLGGNFENNGKLTINGELNLNGNSSFVNNGDLTVEGSLNNNRSLTNGGSLLVRGSFRANGNSTTTNSCKLIVSNELTLNNTLTNNAYVRAGNRLTINGGGSLVLNNGALLSTQNALINGSVSGTGTNKSTLSVTGSSTFNGGSSLRGNLNYCDANGVEVNNARIAASFFNCNNYMPTSACNPDGFGKPVIQDADGDGVADAQDEYPNDAARAFNTYYPSAEGWSTYCFEDLWPSLGDYDFNDLVVNYRMTRILNARNQLTDLKMDVTIRAMGASQDNGFGVQLDGVGSSEVASVTGISLAKRLISLNGNRTEAGQAKAVIIAFDSPNPLISRLPGSMFNTVKNGPGGNPGRLLLTVTFKTPIDAGRVAQSTVNPFIFIGGDRSREVHLTNYAPTNRAATGLFGSQNDASNPGGGRYYRSAQNLPWALEIPTIFTYPAEGVSIMDAYSYFGAWALSSGSQRTDWYQSNPGYVNPAKVY